MMDDIFVSKIDTWLLVVFILAGVVSIIACANSLQKGGALNIIWVGILACLGIVLPGWLLLGTHYVMGTDELRVKSGPFSWQVPISTITSIRETRNSRSSPALSLDRIQIEYGENDTIMISPKRKKHFIEALSKRRTLSPPNGATL